jgi:hypothetical protein
MSSESQMDCIGAHVKVSLGVKHIGVYWKLAICFGGHPLRPRSTIAGRVERYFAGLRTHPNIIGAWIRGSYGDSSLRHE